MKISIIKPVEIETKFLEVRAGVRYPEDSEFIEVNMDDDGKPYNNYISDDEENPKIQTEIGILGMVYSVALSTNE